MIDKPSPPAAAPASSGELDAQPQPRERSVRALRWHSLLPIRTVMQSPRADPSLLRECGPDDPPMEEYASLPRLTQPRASES